MLQDTEIVEDFMQKTSRGWRERGRGGGHYRLPHVPGTAHLIFTRLVFIACVAGAWK